MKKILSMIILAVALFSCKEEETDPPLVEQEVTFNAEEVQPSLWLKSTDGDFDCYEGITPDYARIVISAYEDPFLPKVFRLDGKLYTQAIKLFTGTYTVEQFLLMDDEGTPDDLNDDLVYMAVPEAGSTFAPYTSPTVPFTFPVGEFVKTEIPLELLCYQPAFYEYFGFDWFALTEITIREQCFFGDICVNPNDYLTSLYDHEQMPDGCQVDMPALVQVIVKKNGVEVPYSPFTNATPEANYGVGEPLCVRYPDNMNVDDEVFTFELYVLVKSAQPGVFLYQLYHTFQVMDDEQIMAGNDGVVDFAIGDCVMQTDYQFDWLPAPTPAK